MEDSVNTAMAEPNTNCEPKRSATQPLMGMKIAMVTKYAVSPALISTAFTPKESPLWNMKNVIVTPHSAGHSEGNEGRVQVQFVKNLVRFLSNEPLLHLAINEG